MASSPPRIPPKGSAALRPRVRSILALVLAVVLGASAGVSAAPAHPADWHTPVPGFTVVAAFDKPARNWESGHRGIDVGALPGEAIRAPDTGTVRFAGNVAGRPVMSLLVDAHVVSFEPVITDLRPGDKVFAGHPVGVVDDPSHCESGCIHVGVWRAEAEKEYLNPALFFAADPTILLPESQAPVELPSVPPGGDATSEAGPWGGHDNGRIPAVALCPVAHAPGHLLRCDAARSFDALNRAHRQEFGRWMSVTDSYRDYQTQVVLKRRKGRMAATPGKSNHGWGLAVDLGGGINSFGSVQHEWMRANGPHFGWIHPAWARSSGSLPEPWHWEFRAGGDG